MDATTYCPRPGTLKTASVTIRPPKREENSKPISVTTGRRPLRSPCWSTTRRPPAPAPPPRPPPDPRGAARPAEGGGDLEADQRPRGREAMAQPGLEHHPPLGEALGPR